MLLETILTIGFSHLVTRGIAVGTLSVAKATTIQVPLVRDLAIVNSSYRGNIMHLNAWQIIRANVSFISISRGLRGRAKENEQSYGLVEIFDLQRFELSGFDCNNLSYRRVCFILLYYISFIFQREESSSKIFYLHLVADDHRTFVLALSVSVTSDRLRFLIRVGTWGNPGLLAEIERNERYFQGPPKRRNGQSWKDLRIELPLDVYIV